MRTKIVAIGFSLTLGLSVSVASSTEIIVLDRTANGESGFLGEFAPKIHIVSDSNEALSRVVAGEAGDLVYLCSDETDAWIKNDQIVPYDKSNLLSWDSIHDEFRHVDGIVRGNEIFLFPIESKNMGLIYRTDQITDENISLQLLKEETFQGKILVPDSALSAYTMAALATGSKDDFPNLNDKQFEDASNYLRAVHENVLFYWSKPEELNRFVAEGVVAMGWGWDNSEFNLILNEVPAKMMRDSNEGFATKVCGYAHLKNSTAQITKVYELLEIWKSEDYKIHKFENLGITKLQSFSSQSVLNNSASVDSWFAGNLDDIGDSLFVQAIDSELEERMRVEFKNIKSGKGI